MDSLLAFALGDSARKRGEPLRVFDWNKAAKLIAERKPKVARAGLSGDWEYTGGTIFRDGVPEVDAGTYLASVWATPELEMDDDEIVDCWILASETDGWDASTRWPESALAILRGVTAAP